MTRESQVSTESEHSYRVKTDTNNGIIHKILPQRCRGHGRFGEGIVDKRDGEILRCMRLDGGLPDEGALGLLALAVLGWHRPKGAEPSGVACLAVFTVEGVLYAQITTTLDTDANSDNDDGKETDAAKRLFYGSSAGLTPDTVELLAVVSDEVVCPLANEILNAFLCEHLAANLSIICAWRTSPEVSTSQPRTQQAGANQEPRRPPHYLKLVPVHGLPALLIPGSLPPSPTPIPDQALLDQTLNDQESSCSLS